MAKHDRNLNGPTTPNLVTWVEANTHRYLIPWSNGLNQQWKNPQVSPGRTVTTGLRPGSMASQRGVQIVVFSSAGEATPSGAAGFVSASGDTWEMAATKAVLEINELQLQHGHLGHKHGYLRAPKGIHI